MSWCNQRRQSTSSNCRCKWRSGTIEQGVKASITWNRPVELRLVPETVGTVLDRKSFHFRAFLHDLIFNFALHWIHAAHRQWTISLTVLDLNCTLTCTCWLWISYMYVSMFSFKLALALLKHWVVWTQYLALGKMKHNTQSTIIFVVVESCYQLQSLWC